MHRQLRHALLILVWILALIPAARPAGAQPAPADITMSVVPAFGGVYRTGSWIPLVVTVENRGVDLAAIVQAVDNATRFHVALDLPRGSRKTVTLYVRPSGFVHRVTVRLLHRADELARSDARLEPLPLNTLLVGILSATPIAVPVPAGLNRVVAEIALAELPDQALGMGSFDVLVFEDRDTSVLSPAQRASLQHWVAAGGRLLLAGGPGLRATLAGLPEGLLPARADGVSVQDLSALAQYAGSDAPPAALPAARLSPVPEARVVVAGEGPLLVERPVGRGTVTQLAIALTGEAMQRWDGLPLLWGRLLSSRATLVPPGLDPGMSINQLVEGNVATMLTRLPALELPSLTLLGLVALAYIAVVGPGAYLVLRRLDRLALGWVVVPALTVVFALIAYGIGFAQRGGDVVINQISLVEPLGAGSARIRTFVGLFSPGTRSYRLDGPGALLYRPSSILGPWGNEPLEGTFEQATRGAATLAVSQWSMRALIGETLTAYEGLEAELVVSGDLLQGEVRNRGDQPLLDVVVAQGMLIERLGRLDPGQSRPISLRVQGRLDQGGPPLGQIAYGGPGGVYPDNPEARRRLLLAELVDQLFSYTPVPRGPEPLVLAWLAEPPLRVGLPDARHARQDLTLVALRPALHVAPGPVTYAPGWFTMVVEPGVTGEVPACWGGRGLGVMLVGRPVIVALALPAGLDGARIETLDLRFASDGPASPQRVQIYDWQRNAWEPVAIDPGQLVHVTDAARFVGSGQPLVRIELDGDTTTMGSCIFVDATARGVMP